MKVPSYEYSRIIAGTHWFEVSLVIGDGDPDNGFHEDTIVEIATDRPVFAEDKLKLGCCVSGQISAKLLLPHISIPRKAKLRPYVMAVNDREHSEWIQMGEFFLDAPNIDTSGVDVITLNGFDALLFAEATCPVMDGTDRQIVCSIAGWIGVTVEGRTLENISKSYIGSITESKYSMREVLGFIASAYGGCFIINDFGELQLIQLNTLPERIGYLVTSGTQRKILTIGGVRIRV